MDTQKSTDKGGKNVLLRLIPVYVICAALLFSYFFVLFLKPDVCIEYQMYYIDDVLADWPGYGGLDYKYGETVFFGKSGMNANSKRRGYGWAQREDTFCFTDGSQADVYFMLESISSLSVSISVKELACTSYSVYANDTLIAEDLTHKNTSFSISIPKETLTSELLKLTFKINTPTRPSGEYKTGSTGLLGVQVETITITEEG